MTQKKLENACCDSSYPDLYLASHFSRRVLLLEQLSLDFSVLAVDINESQEAIEPPNDYVLRMAKKRLNKVFAIWTSRMLMLHIQRLFLIGIYMANQEMQAMQTNATDAVWS